MGVCASSPTIKLKRNGGRSSSRQEGTSSDYIGRPKGIVVIDVDGDQVQELKQPTQARGIISQYPNHVLCNSEAMSVGTCAPHVPDDEELQPGQIYFLVPLRQAQNPLSLPELCNLAIKASSALAKR
ncbi:hypothetical protein RchiOBHm_Chr2g0103101 [Rosa chinensis]|uniref:Uncharacterized protein n=1 Tax=Rosa chinensis TaxID=74649 RepID=A0A2P6RMT5_ROSCH|nr:uncharacterized protein LOC112183747 [Rosa chinensis]PRQ47749.1 hypothetical protein RchiOBHm_Chr2g0103101 [Rosa chinensis]